MCTGRYKCTCYKYSGKEEELPLDMCDYCYYAKKFKKQSFKYKIFLSISLVLFLTITYVVWQ